MAVARGWGRRRPLSGERRERAAPGLSGLAARVLLWGQLPPSGRRPHVGWRRALICCRRRGGLGQERALGWLRSGTAAAVVTGARGREGRIRFSARWSGADDGVVCELPSGDRALKTIAALLLPNSGVKNGSAPDLPP